MKKKTFIRIIFFSFLFLLEISSLIIFQYSKTLLAASPKILVAAAASLQPVLEEIDSLYSSKVNYTFASSGILQQQIEQGAPIDLFISASPKPIKKLEEKNLLLSKFTTNLLTNKIALITSKNNSFPLKDFMQLTQPKIKLIAIGEPKTVPAGQYAIEFFNNLKILSFLQSKFIFGNDVKATLTYVENGDVDAGIVYFTDAKSSNKVKIVTIADKKLHSPIIYPVAIIKNTKLLADTKKYVEFIKSKQARKIFEKYGFGIVK